MEFRLKAPAWVRRVAAVGSCVVLAVWPAPIAAQYEEGRQHVYPFYYPEDQINYPNAGLPDYPHTPSPIGPPSSRPPANIRSLQVQIQPHAGAPSLLIHQNYADNVSRLFADLNVHLTSRSLSPVGGWGYRSHETQIQLRREHCGPSQYDIWQKPSSQCVPPTATPGRSRHEWGLAVDFYHIRSRQAIGTRSEAFAWLSRHATGYGLRNLPSESWHWSDTGR